MIQMGVEPKIGGKPPKWMVYFMENPMNKWDDLGRKKPYFWVDTQMIQPTFWLRSIVLLGE